ncbi:MAG: hypothetical protein GC179_07340 [Anaerolineaceae bacterium]|nr:hypothetical protein [Anaerolineaceae bacterium]
MRNFRMTLSRVVHRILRFLGDTWLIEVLVLERNAVKRLLVFLTLAVMSWLVLSACAPTDSLAQGGQIKAPTAAPETTESPAPAARVPQIVGKEGGLYPPQDISLVTTTGKPQLLNSYADWCTTCQHNKSIVDGVREQFADKIDVIDLNIDVPETQSVRDQFNITDRSQYLLIDAKGAVIQKWYGFLDGVNLPQAIQDYLTKNNL